MKCNLCRSEVSLGSDGRISEENSLASRSSDIETIVAKATSPKTIRKSRYVGNRSLAEDQSSIAIFLIS